MLSGRKQNIPGVSEKPIINIRQPPTSSLVTWPQRPEAWAPCCGGRRKEGEDDRDPGALQDPQTLSHVLLPVSRHPDILRTTSNYYAPDEASVSHGTFFTNPDTFEESFLRAVRVAREPECAGAAEPVPDGDLRLAHKPHTRLQPGPRNPPCPMENSPNSLRKSI